MSFHMKVQLAAISNGDYLLRALTTLNYQFETHEQPVTVRGWQDETIPTPCRIVIRRETANLGADIGFHLDQNGNFNLVSDSFANRELPQFMNDLKRTYEEEQALDRTRQLGYQLESRGEWVEIEGKRYARMVVTQ